MLSKYEFLKSDRTRVLINGIHAKSGGGITYLTNILPLMAKSEQLELHLFIHKEQFELFGEFDERVRLHLLEFSSGFFANLIWEQFVLPILANVMSVDVTLSPANYGPLMAPRNIIMLRNSLAVVGRETRILKRFYWAGLAVMTALSLLTCKRAIAVSDYARNALTFGMAWPLGHKVEIVHHGVKDIFQPSKKSIRGRYLLSVSDIYVQKNLHTLIHSLFLIRKEIPDLRLKLAGNAVDKGYLHEITESIRQYGLEDAVEFLGKKSTEELVELYQECAIFVFPSTVETFGNPLVEAMACGTPIASSNSSVMPEILGDAAEFFEPLDPQAIASAIRDLLGNPEQQEVLVSNALQRAKCFSWEDTAQKTVEIIMGVAPQRSKTRLKTARKKSS